VGWGHSIALSLGERIEEWISTRSPRTERGKGKKRKKKKGCGSALLLLAGCIYKGGGENGVISYRSGQCSKGKKKKGVGRTVAILTASRP